MSLPLDANTERVARSSLHASEERLRLLIDAVKDYAIFVLDPNGRVATWNPGAEQIKGYKAHEIIGEHFSKFYPQEAIDRGWPDRELLLAAQHGRFEDEGWRLRKDGSPFWANVIITALRNDAGELTGFAKITRDLSERKRYEEQLRRSEERVRLLIDGVKDYAIISLDPTGRVVTWNSGAQAIAGYTPSEIVGEHFSKFYPKESIESGWPDYELAVARDQGRFEDEGWRVRKDGTRFWANVIITALTDDHGRLRGFAKISRDLTERRRIESLEESNKRINEFLAMLAHELRNPLAPIRNAVAVMHQPGATESHLEWARGVIDRQITHLTHLVDDLLDVSRITTGKITLRRDQVDLREVVARGVEATRPLIEARRQQLSVTVPETPVVVNGDVTRLTQVVLNLLNNASKYTPEAGQITLTVVKKTELARIIVRDTGIGIPPDILPTIFDLFAQGHRTLDRAEGGLGIGLTLVRRLIEMHGGDVRAISEGANRGSEFTVQLPLTRDRAESGPDAPAVDAPAPSRRILIVDDNEDSAESMAMLLQLGGHDTRTAPDGPRALEIAQEYGPDLVLLDLGLPGMSGFEVADHLRSLPGFEKVVLVAMTGYGQDEDRRRTKAAGFAHHLVKPVDPATLDKLVTELTPR